MPVLWIKIILTFTCPIEWMGLGIHQTEDSPHSVNLFQCLCDHFSRWNLTWDIKSEQPKSVIAVVYVQCHYCHVCAASFLCGNRVHFNMTLAILREDFFFWKINAKIPQEIAVAQIVYKISMQDFMSQSYGFLVGICGLLTHQLESKAAAGFLLMVKLLYISKSEECSCL